MSLEEIRRSADEGKLVVVLGAGSSIALAGPNGGAKTWVELIQSGLEYCARKGIIESDQQSRFQDILASNDIDELITAAEFVSRKLGAPSGTSYARWLQDEFETCSPEGMGMKNAILAMAKRKLPIATLNYDTIVDDALGLESITCDDVQKTRSWLDRSQSSILHLHGVWKKPRSCIFGIRDYHDALSDELRHLLQASLSTFNRILFVGCGDTFSDPNFSNLIAWLSEKIGASAPQHYALVRDSEVQARLADSKWRNFVDPVGYGAEFSDLPGFLLSCFPTRVAADVKTTKAKSDAAKAARLIASYKNFLLEDCGEMAIEGMRADLETARRKFDLEKLFVPLQVDEVPPEISSDHENREAIVREWEEEHPRTDFGKAFQGNRRLALLALPGGGKTILLKRLAVAYSDEQRRAMSEDFLPDEDLVPVLIRCREWKQYIRMPILTMLDEIHKVTGEKSLAEFGAAVEKSLKAGNVLFLVDGLDELHDDADRAIFVENLEKFIEKFPKIRLVVTSREAGFDLVAPSLSRFCCKHKIAPLSESAIRLLTSHWHQLMGGGNPASVAEGVEIAEDILRNPSIRGLAENPLLLTMLLVVKHGAGRLPPDRVTLYERAVEVLLDTWNIKGHAPLKIKESVPQLACVAYELMLKGKQTATEREIVEILDDARAKLPMIGRYAKDSSSDFLRRVELRSSLLVEGGHVLSDGKAVPFYQFRHLTFQEYLAAVAAVEGHLVNDETTGGIFPALSKHLVSDEWKEVVPMAVVLGKLQSAPVIEELIDIARKEKESAGSEVKNDLFWRSPPAVGILSQLIVEEAVIPAHQVDEVCSLVCFFGASVSNSKWDSVVAGPYGDDLRIRALNAYMSKDYLSRSTARLMVAQLEASIEAPDYWSDDECAAKHISEFSELSDEEVARSILKIGGGFWNFRDEAKAFLVEPVYDAVQSKIFSDNEQTRYAAIWVWGFWRHLALGADILCPKIEASVLQALIDIYLETCVNGDTDSSISYLASELKGMGRGSFGSEVISKQRDQLEAIYGRAISRDLELEERDFLFLARIGFLVDDFMTDEMLRELLEVADVKSFQKSRVGDIFQAVGLS